MTHLIGSSNCETQCMLINVLFRPISKDIATRWTFKETVLEQRVYVIIRAIWLVCQMKRIESFKRVVSVICNMWSLTYYTTHNTHLVKFSLIVAAIFCRNIFGVLWHLQNKEMLGRMYWKSFQTVETDFLSSLLFVDQSIPVNTSQYQLVMVSCVLLDITSNHFSQKQICFSLSWMDDWGRVEKSYLWISFISFICLQWTMD